jgi:hypothetical protein
LRDLYTSSALLVGCRRRRGGKSIPSSHFHSGVSTYGWLRFGFWQILLLFSELARVSRTYVEHAVYSKRRRRTPRALLLEECKHASVTTDTGHGLPQILCLALPTLFQIVEAFKFFPRHSHVQVAFLFGVMQLIWTLLVEIFVSRTSPDHRRRGHLF